MTIDFTTQIIALIGLNVVAFLIYVIGEVTVLRRPNAPRAEEQELAIEDLIDQVEKLETIERGAHRTQPTHSGERFGGFLPAAARSCRRMAQAATRTIANPLKLFVGDAWTQLARSLSEVRVPAQVRKRTRRETEVLR